MISSTRNRVVGTARRLVHPSQRTFVLSGLRRAGENLIQTNDPSPKPPPQNVSGTNALETDAFGAHDKKLQELPEDGEKQRQVQAPNRNTIWAPSQRPRDVAMSGPRFEQTIIEYQVSA